MSRQAPRMFGGEKRLACASDPGNERLSLVAKEVQQVELPLR
jgi:hypothetical protein